MASATILISFRFLHYALATHHPPTLRHSRPTRRNTPTHSSLPILSRVDCSLRHVIAPFTSPPSPPHTRLAFVFTRDGLTRSVKVAFFRPSLPQKRTRAIARRKFSLAPHPPFLALTLFVRLRRETRSSSVIYTHESSLAPYSRPPHTSRRSFHLATVIIHPRPSSSRHPPREATISRRRLAGRVE